MKRVIFSLILIASLVGCDGPNDPVPLKTTEINFSRPETVGTLPDGRVIKYVVRDMGNLHDHTIYFVDNTITVNSSVFAGKSTRNQVSVLIDAVMYAPIPTEKKP